MVEAAGLECDKVLSCVVAQTQGSWERARELRHASSASSRAGSQFLRTVCLGHYPRLPDALAIRLPLRIR